MSTEAEIVLSAIETEECKDLVAETFETFADAIIMMAEDGTLSGPQKITITIEPVTLAEFIADDGEVIH